MQTHKVFALLCNEGLVSKDPKSCDTCAPYRSFFPDHHFSCRLLQSLAIVVSYICISLAAEVFLGGSEYKSCELECQFCPSRRTRVRKIINHRRRRRHRTRAVAFYPLCWPQPKSCLLIRSCPVTIYQLIKIFLGTKI